MNWEFIQKYIPLYQEAAVLTVRIGFMGIAVAILIGLVFHADYEATFVDTYGLDYEESLVIEGGVVSE